MRNVEPLIAAELEQMLPLPDGRRADWADVLRRAGVDDAVRVRPRGLAPTGRRRRRSALVAAVVVAALVGVGVGIKLTSTASGGQSIDDLLSQVQNSFGDNRLLSASVNGQTLTVRVAAPDEPSQVSATFEAQILAAAFHDSLSSSGQTPINSVQYLDAGGNAIPGYGPAPVGTESSGAPLPKIPPLAKGACSTAAQSVQTSSLAIESVVTLPYAGGACAFKFQTSDPSSFDAGLVVGKLVNSIGDANERSYLVEVDDQAGVPQFVDDYTPSGGGVEYTKPGSNGLPAP
ncbi:MAG: hypothetical protein ACXVRQ_04005 [Gaiellaceae bacterium]